MRFFCWLVVYVCVCDGARARVCVYDDGGLYVSQSQVKQTHALIHPPPHTSTPPHQHTTTSLFPPLLTAALWERKANIPGLVLLMEAYLSKGAPALLPHLEPILGIFSNLVGFRASEKYAFDLLMSVFEHFPPEALAKYEPRLFQIVLTRLQVRLAWVGR